MNLSNIAIPILGSFTLGAAISGCVMRRMMKPKLLPNCPDCGEQSELTSHGVCRACEQRRLYQTKEK